MRHVNHARPLSAPVLLGRTRNGAPVWSIAGGAEDDDEGDGDGEEDEEGDDDDEDGDEEEDAQLGAAGEKALKAWKDRAKAAERENKQLKRTAPKTKAKAKGKDGGDEDDERDPETLRQQARDEANAEVARDRALDKLETRAARKFADPEDARALLADKADSFLDDEGKPDVEAIDEELEELLEKKPHLAAQGGKWKGGGDGGAKRSKPTRAKSIGEAVGRHYTPSS